MAIQSTIGGSGTLFVGEDKQFILTLPGVDMAGWSLLFDVRAKVTSADPAILSKTPVVQGVFNLDPLVSTQKAVATVSDTEMNAFKAATYQFSFKRMDDGVETVLAYGPFMPEKATAP